MLKAISLKFGMWGAEVGGRVLSKNLLVSSKQHRAMEVQKLHFRSSCKYNLIKNSQAVKKGAAPIKAMVKKDVKSKVAAKKWL